MTQFHFLPCLGIISNKTLVWRKWRDESFITSLLFPLSQITNWSLLLFTSLLHSSLSSNLDRKKNIRAWKKFPSSILILAKNQGDLQNIWKLRKKSWKALEQKIVTVILVNSLPVYSSHHLIEPPLGVPNCEMMQITSVNRASRLLEALSACPKVALFSGDCTVLADIKSSSFAALIHSIATQKVNLQMHCIGYKWMNERINQCAFDVFVIRHPSRSCPLCLVSPEIKLRQSGGNRAY